jgi:predicted aminopeptidase
MVRQTLLLLLLLPTLGGCSYLWQAGRGQWQLMHGRQPIATLLASEQTDAVLKGRLQQVQSARDFAVQVLHLPDNSSYRSYRALQRPYVVWNVVAAPEFSVTPIHWCFPFTGCIAYRGYFREASARRYAARLQQRGFDTHVGGVAAYSTLGKFSDPVLDTMLRYGDAELAGILFHELAHQLLYVPGDSEFNEAFATAVEEAGLNAWLGSSGRTAELRTLAERRAWQQRGTDLLGAARLQLAALYREKLPPAQLRARKATAFTELGVALITLQRESAGAAGAYQTWVDAGLNNAHLAAVATYQACVPAWRRLQAAAPGDWPRFYAAARAVAKRGPAARREFCAGSQAF